MLNFENVIAFCKSVNISVYICVEKSGNVIACCKVYQFICVAKVVLDLMLCVYFE